MIMGYGLLVSFWLTHNFETEFTTSAQSFVWKRLSFGNLGIWNCLTFVIIISST